MGRCDALAVTGATGPGEAALKALEMTVPSGEPGTPPWDGGSAGLTFSSFSIQLRRTASRAASIAALAALPAGAGITGRVASDFT